MKRLLNLVALVAAWVLLPPLAIGVNSAQTNPEAPPVEQNLIREGDFAVSLAETLGISTTDNEAEAENDLAAVGIEPRNGWIGDYPVTPDIIDEVYDAVSAAADANKLAMSKEEALRRYDDLTAELSMPIRSTEEVGYAENRPEEYNGEYQDPAVINNYYASEGPPVVTYYTPPWDYYYMYAWVPYPFWWSSFYFPGYFVLHDFHTFRRVVVVNRHGHRFVNKRVTNHYYDRHTNRISRVDPVNRAGRDSVNRVSDAPRVRGFRNAEARRGAESIFRRESVNTRSGRGGEQGRRDSFVNGMGDRSREQALKNNSGFMVRGNRSAGASGSNGRVQTFRAPNRQREVDQRFSNRSDSFRGRDLRSFSRGSFSGTRSFNMPRGDSGSSTFRSRSFIGSGSSGHRSFSNRSGGSSGFRSFSGGGSSGNRGFSGRGGFGGHGFSGGRGGRGG